ncbi:hypothetical protein TNCV_3737011 [Trichonephila clavipes]|nr:hypothetical protein TNCV_3737011 [Trichonephila clavipes]
MFMNSWPATREVRVLVPLKSRRFQGLMYIMSHLPQNLLNWLGVELCRNVTRDAELRLFGRSRDDYSTIGSSTPHAVDFEAGGWSRNCAGHLTVGCIKEGQRLTSLRT